MISTHAPIRLLKLEFRRLEISLRKEFKNAENEINEQSNALESANCNLDELIKRHEYIFGHSDFFNMCETYLNDLRYYGKELGNAKLDERANVENIYISLEDNWISIVKKIENINGKLRSLPNVFSTFESNLNQLDSWLSEISVHSMKIFDSSLGSKEYTRAIENLTPLLDELESKRNQLNATKSQYELILKQNQSFGNNQLRNFYIDVEHKFENLLITIAKLEARIDYLKLVAKISHDLDRVTNEIRNLSILSERRFIPEDAEAECPLQIAVDEHKNIMENIKSFQLEVDEMRHELERASNQDYLLMPVYINEKLNNVSEIIRQSLNQELDRRSSLLEIKQIQDQKKMKLNSLNRNLEVLHTILTNSLKNGCTSRASFMKSTDENSLNELCLSVTTENLDDTSKICVQSKDLGKYLSRLGKCKELIESSRLILNEIKPNNLDNTSHLEQHHYFEHKLNQYESEIDAQIDLFERNLAKQIHLEGNLESLGQNLAELARRFEKCGLELERLESVGALESEIEIVRSDLAQIDAVRVEINRLSNEKNALLEEETKNLGQSRLANRLLEGFNETIWDMDVKKDKEITMKLNKMSHELNQIEKMCQNKINNMVLKIDEINLRKKQNKLNILMDTLNLQSDAVAVLGIDNGHSDFDTKEEFEDLRQESETILLDKVTLEESRIFSDNEENNRVLDVRIEHETSQTKGGFLETNEDEERIEEITVDYVISTNEIGDTFIEETSQFFERFQNDRTCLNDKSEFRNRNFFDDEVIENERQMLEEEILKREIEERDKLDKFERELALKLELKCIEMEQLDAERQLSQKLDEERQELETKEFERIRRIEMEREENLRLERLEIERIRLEREEKVNKERERLENERLSREKVEKEKQESLEREKHDRIEKEKREVEMIEAIEKERREKLRIERIEMQNMRKEEEKKLEIEKFEKERLKQIEHDGNEKLRLERIEIERLEEAKIQQEKASNQEARSKQMEIERTKQEQKLKLEERLKDMCAYLNKLKENIVAIETDEVDQKCQNEEIKQIEIYEQELNNFKIEVKNMAKHQQQQHMSTNTTSDPDSLIFELFDQAILTQVELIKSFINYLIGKLSEKKKDLLQKETIRSKLSEYERNLTSYIQLAKKYTINGEQNIFIENRLDLQNRIESIESIENSIHNCLKQISELKKSYRNTSKDADLLKYRIEIEANIIKPLSMHSSYLKSYLVDLDDFSFKLTSLKDFLKVELDLDTLLAEMESGPHFSDDLYVDYERYSNLRDKLSKKMSQSCDLFMLGANLFEKSVGSHHHVIETCIAQDFVKTRNLVDDLLNFLNDTSRILECAKNRFEKLKHLESKLNNFLTELNQIEKENATSKNVDIVGLNKMKLEQIIELKKMFRSIVDEKELIKDQCDNTEFDLRLKELMDTKLFDLNAKLDDTIKYANEKASLYENQYHENIVKNLHSRTALQDLNKWIELSMQKLDGIEFNFKNVDKIFSAYDKSNSNDFKSNDPYLNKLECLKHELADMVDELKNKRERELLFILDSIETEIKQGFYDLNTTENCNRLQFDWNLLKQKLKNLFEIAELSLIKMKKFNHDLSQINDWLSLKQTQNEFDHFTRLKTSNADKTLIFDAFQAEEIDSSEQNLLRNVNSYKSELESLRNEWLLKENSAEDNFGFNPILIPYINQKCDLVKLGLENLEKICKLKLETNLSELKKSYSIKINQIYANIDEEISYLKHGKLTSFEQFQFSVKNLDQLLIQLENSRVEMRQALEKYELQLKSTCDCRIETVLNLENTSNKMDSQKSNLIATNLNYRELETSARSLLGKLNSNDIFELWSKYDNLLVQLRYRLDKTMESIINDLNNVDSIINTEFNLFNKSNLYEPTLKDMWENRRLFEEFEAITEQLCDYLGMNQNSEQKFAQNKVELQEKFKELAILADKLSSCFEQASIEYKNFMDLTHLANDVCEKSNRIIFECDLSASSICLKQLFSDLESIEIELKDVMNKFKLLNLKDSQRIGKVYELSSLITLHIGKLRDKKKEAHELIEERSCYVEMKLNEIGSALNEYRILLRFESCQNLDNLIFEMKSLLDNESELAKLESELDLLDSEYRVDSDRLKIECQRELLEKIKSQFKIICKKDGLLDQLYKLKDISAYVKDFDLNSTDTGALLLTRDHFLAVRHTLDKIITNRDFVTDLNLREIYNVEAEINRVLNEANELDNIMLSYRLQFSKIETTLKDVGARIPVQYGTECDLITMEARLNELKNLKQVLVNSQLNQDFDRLQTLANRLANNKRIDLSNYENSRIQYYDIICKLDKQIKSLEFNLCDMKRLTEKSQLLLDLIKDSHKILANVCLKRLNAESKEFLNFSSMNFIDEPPTFQEQHLTNEFKVERTLNQWIDLLRIRIMARLNDHEPIKVEILNLYSQILKASNFTSTKKHELVKSIVDKLLFEWNLINEKCIEKIKKLEQLKSKLNNLDLKLNKIREYIYKLEGYLNTEMFNDNLAITNYRSIVERKSKLESLLECLTSMDQDTENLFSVCLNANKAYFSSNSQNETLVLSLKERWSNLKLMIKDRLFKLNNVWILVSDLNEQMENFYQILSKTETFYKNTVSTSSSCSNTCFMRLISELYLVINQDYKLIKYLNESYISLVKLVNNFSSNNCLNEMKQKLLSINSRWDALHNEIAVRIKTIRKYEHYPLKPTLGLPNIDYLHIWANEISLLITNLEHLTTKELQLKFNEVQDLKKEICSQTEFLFNNDNPIKISSTLIDLIKNIMKRIIRLDSFIQKSLPTSRAPSAMSNSNGSTSNLHHPPNLPNYTLLVNNGYALVT